MLEHNIPSDTWVARGIINQPSEVKLTTETITDERALWDEQSELAEDAYAAHQEHISNLREQLTSAEKDLLAHSIARDALKGVPKDWKDPNAGAYVPAFFVSVAGSRVIPEELIESDDLQLSLIRPLEIASLTTVDKARCPSCGGPTLLPIIERFVDDSADDADSEWLVPCPTCGAQEVPRP